MSSSPVQLQRGQSVNLTTGVVTTPVTTIAGKSYVKAGRK